MHQSLTHPKDSTETKREIVTHLVGPVPPSPPQQPKKAPTTGLDGATTIRLISPDDARHLHKRRRSNSTHKWLIRSLTTGYVGNFTGLVRPLCRASGNQRVMSECRFVLESVYTCRSPLAQPVYRTKPTEHTDQTVEGRKMSYYSKSKEENPSPETKR